MGENISRIERLEKQNNDFSESLNTFQPMQDDKVGQVKKKAENLQVLLKSVNKDIEYKHKELQNLMRIQEDRSRRNSIRIEGTVELPKENWKDTENKLRKMLYDYCGIAERVIIERTHRAEKREKS